MSEPTGSFGEYGSGPWYYDIHDADHQRNRYATRRERDEALAAAKKKYPHCRFVRGDDRSDRRMSE